MASHGNRLVATFPGRELQRLSVAYGVSEYQVGQEMTNFRDAQANQRCDAF